MSGPFDEPVANDESQPQETVEDMVEKMKCFGVRIDKEKGEVFGGGGKLAVNTIGVDGEKITLVLYPGESAMMLPSDVKRINEQSMHFDRLVKPNSQVEGEKIRPGQRKQTVIEPVDYDASM